MNGNNGWELWNKFTSTGSVYDYLEFAKARGTLAEGSAVDNPYKDCGQALSASQKQGKDMVPK